jgi:hypothetical protein
VISNAKLEHREHGRTDLLFEYVGSSVATGTAATAIFTSGPAPDNDGVLISSSAASFVGGSGVTTSTGFPIAANTAVLVPTTGSEPLSLYAVVSTGTATVSTIYPS